MKKARTAIIVDDSASIRFLITQTLEEAGFHVIQARDGREALNMSEGTDADLIVTDLNMPVMDGISLIQELRARARTKHTPILLLTTESRPEHKARARAAGATGWLTKPFDPAALRSTVKKVLP